MDFIRPFFEGKNRFVQILFLLLFMLGGALIFNALGQLIVLIAYPDSNLNEALNSPGYLRLTQILSSIGLFLMPALLFAYCHDKKWFTYNALDTKPHFLLVNMVLLLSLTLLPLVALLSQWNQAVKFPDALSRLEHQFQSWEAAAERIQSILMMKHTYPTLIANLLVMAVLPALSEELMFQGTIQVFLTDLSKKPHLAVWITALIFSIIHFEFYGFLPRLLLGAYLAYLFYWSRSLWLPILAHFLHNALSILIDFTLQGRGLNTDNIRFTDFRGAVPLVITCTVVTVMGLVFMWRIQKDLKEGKFPTGGNNRKI